MGYGRCCFPVNEEQGLVTQEIDTEWEKGVTNVLYAMGCPSHILTSDLFPSPLHSTVQCKMYHVLHNRDFSSDDVDSCPANKDKLCNLVSANTYIH